jgi:hypothetical protein
MAEEREIVAVLCVTIASASNPAIIGAPDSLPRRSLNLSWRDRSSAFLKQH